MYVFKAQKLLRKNKYKKHLAYYRKKRSFIARLLPFPPVGLGKMLYHEMSRPLMLICETVNICTNNCIICPYEKMTRKKQIMSIELFDKIVKEYSDIGGGCISLTPEVGEVFLDKYLVERISIVKKYTNISKISMTTNGVAAELLDPDSLKYILSSISSLHISVYGIDEEEYAVMTRTNSYMQFIKSLLTIVNTIDNPDKLVFGFRLLKPYSTDKIENWMLSTLGNKYRYLHTNSYANWGGSINTNEPLPFAGTWIEEKENTEQCMMPLCSLRIFSNGSVSFCPCPDYDNISEMNLGNSNDYSLSEIFNSERHAGLWDFKKNMPEFCRKCTFHKRINEISQHEEMFVDPLTFIVG